MRSRWRRGPVAASPNDGFSAGFMEQPCIAVQRDFASSGPAVSATATLAQVGFGSELGLDGPNGLGNEACKLDAPAPSRPFGNGRAHKLRCRPACGQELGAKIANQCVALVEQPEQIQSLR